MQKTTSPDKIQQFFKDQGKYVVTFLGFSGAGYEHADSMLLLADRVLDSYNPAYTVVNIGATPEGIGAIYPLAKRKGFYTTGIVSSQALEYAVPLSDAVDQPFFVRDSLWGGQVPGKEKLSPTSRLMVAVSDELIAIGGGEVARDELLAAQQLGKKTQFFPLDFNHETAKAKARKKGETEPEDFRGEAEKSISDQ